MTDPVRDTDLHDLLDRATDAIRTPALAGPALRIARRRRTRRRGAVAAALTSGLVATVVVATHLGGGSVVAPPAGPSESPSVMPPDAVEQREWDPRDVDDLPPATDGVAPALPARIDPPASSPDLADDPVDAAVLAVRSGDTAQLLATDGSWRSVALAGESPRIALSPEGTRLLSYAYADDQTATVHDLVTGASRTLSYPDGFEAWDFSQWRWVDEQTLVLDDLRGGWRVDADTGSAEEVPYPSEFTWAIDPDGVVVESADVSEPASFADWSGGRAREVSSPATGTLEGIRVDADTVVGTSYDDRPFSVVVADRERLEPRAVLPVRDHQGNYSGGGLGVLALADDGTVLLRVSAIDAREVDGFRVVAWDPGTGSLSLVSTAAVTIEDWVVFADALVRRVSGP